MQLHGVLGISNEMPFSGMMNAAQVMGIADGPTEVHKVTLATQVLKQYSPVEGLWPSGHIPALRAAAQEKYADLIEHAVGNE